MNLLQKENERLRKKANAKCGEIFSSPLSVVPDSEVVEQASSTLTAEYVAALIDEGAVVADLTAGLGVNTYHFSKRAKKVFAVEIDSKRAEALNTNLREAGIENVELANENCIEWLEKTGMEFDVVFADPARRTSGKRIVRLEECSPDISKILPILKGGPRVLVKASPLLDISLVFKQYPSLSGVHIVEVGNEVKELILDINLTADNKPSAQFIRCCRLSPDGENGIYEFNWLGDNRLVTVEYLAENSKLNEGDYIYEPSPAMMKAGCWGALMNQFPGMKKFSKDTHLFSSGERYENFPGRVFRLEKFLHSNDLKGMKGAEMNVISRNHPAKAAEIERRYRFIPSGNDYVIACRLAKTPVMVKGIKV